jgi:putative membrane protein
MKRLGFIFGLAALVLEALPAFAQSSDTATAPTSAPGPGYGPMWGWGYGPHMWGWGPGGYFHPFGMIFTTLLVVLLIIVLLRAFGFAGHYGRGPFRHGRGSTALDILEERFARGEIDKAEFEEKRRLLTR